MGFADALSHAGVKYLAASPETMLAPGVPSDVAHAIASNENDPIAMAKSVVKDVMQTEYRFGGLGGFAPAAAFDVLDLDGAKIAKAESAIKTFNDAAVAATRDNGVRAALRDDIGSVKGMARIPDGGRLPWQADRSAIGIYDAVTRDSRLDGALRNDARTASQAVRGLVLAHAENRSFAPFGGSNYSDAVGPTIHAPLDRKQIDPWAKAGISETDNAFYHSTDQDKVVRALA
jgi:hypothetical protein